MFYTEGRKFWIMDLILTSCVRQILILEQNAAGMVFVPFALLLSWKQARGRGARDFCIAGGIPGHCIGKVLFAHSLVKIDPSCQAACIPMMLSLHGKKELFCFSKHENSKYSGIVWFGGFVSFLVKLIKVFWILFWNQPVHKPQIIN